MNTKSAVPLLLSLLVGLNYGGIAAAQTAGPMMAPPMPVPIAAQPPAAAPQSYPAAPYAPAIMPQPAPAVPYPGTVPAAAPIAYQGVVPAQAAVYPPNGVTPEPVYPPPNAYVQPAYPPPVAVPQPAYPGPVYVPQPQPQQATADANVCIPYSPRWVFGAEALWLERTDDRDVLLGNTVLNNGGPNFVVGQLTSGDELFPFETGVKLSLGYRINDRDAIEVIYWGLQHWSVSREIDGDPIGESVLAFSPWTQTDTLIGGFDTTLGYTYSSQVNNAEVNERFAGTGGLTWSIAGLWGIRYVQVSDRFNLHGTDTATGDFENIDIKTANNLLGPQVGVEFIDSWRKFQLNSELKAGLFADFASESYSNLNSSGAIFGSPAGFVPVSASRSGTTAAGVFEFSLIGRYQVSEHLWIRGAWNDYWIAGLALGPRQLGHFNTAGSISLDGPSLGLEAAW